MVVQEVVSVCNHIFRVKEVSTSLFTRHSSPDADFVKLLHRKFGPCLQEFLNQCPTGHQVILNQWDRTKCKVGDSAYNGEPIGIEIDLPSKLVDILERNEQKRVFGNEWDCEVYDELEIPYLECQSLFAPVLEKLLICISTTYAEVSGVTSLVLVGD